MYPRAKWNATGVWSTKHVFPRVAVYVSSFSPSWNFNILCKTDKDRKHDFMGDLSESVLMVFNGLSNWEAFISQPLFLSHMYPKGRALFFSHKCGGWILRVQSDLYYLKVYYFSSSDVIQKNELNLKTSFSVTAGCSWSTVI